MKKRKVMTGLETALTAECGVDGCGALMAGTVHRTAGRQRIRYADRGQRVLAAILLAGLLMKCFSFFDMTDMDRCVEGDDVFEDVTYANGSAAGFREYTAAFPAVYPEEEIRAGAEACVRYEEDDVGRTPVLYTDYEGRAGDSIYTGNDSLTEFVINVETEGFYRMALEYYPVPGSGADIERSILLDGELPYRELGRVRFGRVWKEGTEAPGWIVSDCRDSMGYVDEPLAVYLTEGEHRISLLAVKEPMLVYQVVLRNEKPVQAYAQVKTFWDAVGIKAAGGATIHMEAEQAARASSKMLVSVQQREEPVPAAKKDGTFIDGEDWKEAGQWIEWEFDVEEAGYYYISLYDRQNYVKGTGVCRKIMIDGRIPFAEMENYHFTYGRSWREETLSDAEGVPYVFYLKQGSHRIRMEAVPGDVAGLAGEVWDSVSRFHQICCRIRENAGEETEGGRDPGPDACLSELREELSAVGARLQDTIIRLQELTGRYSDGVRALKALQDSLADLSCGGACSARRVRKYEDRLRACRNWADLAVLQPLAVDYINIVPAGDPSPAAGGLEQGNSVTFFLGRTFFGRD